MKCEERDFGTSALLAIVIAIVVAIVVPVTIIGILLSRDGGAGGSIVGTW